MAIRGQAAAVSGSMVGVMLGAEEGALGKGKRARDHSAAGICERVLRRISEVSLDLEWIFSKG
jgi:hypothetical protein